MNHVHTNVNTSILEPLTNLAPKIIGGSKTGPFEIPFQVSI